MNRGKRLAIVSAFLLIGLVLYAAFPLAALADGGTPQPPPPTSSTPAPDGSTSSGSNQSAVTAVAVQPIAPGSSGSSSTGSTTTGTVSLTSGDPSANATVVPAGTSVVPLDSSGNPVPLATATAATILSTGDPIWCPSGAAPSAGVGGCSASYSNLAQLVSNLTGTLEPNANGTIWITNGADTSGITTVTLDGSSVTNWGTHSLTVQGGWDGTTGGHIVGVTSFNGTNLTISNWGNNVSLNDLIFNNGRVSVQTTGNINLSDFELKNRVALGSSLILTNITGPTSTVHVSNTNVHDNAGDGLSITSNSTVTLSNVTSSSNGGLGAIITTNGAVTIDQGAFSSNGADGLNVSAAGNVNLDNVTADLNNAAGVLHGGTWLSTTHGNIDVSNSEFSGNFFDGLQAIDSYLNGSVNLTSVKAQNNDFSGSGFASAYLVSGANGDVSIDTGLFSNNYYDALWVQSGRSISLSQITADNNQSAGSTHAATYLLGGTSGDVTIDTGSFSNNASDGLYVKTGEAINLTNITANNNQSGGHIGAGTNLTSTSSGVTINGGQFNNNAYDGLDAKGNLSIDLNNVKVDNNQGTGHTGAAANLTAGSTGNVIVNTGSFSNNGYDGLNAQAGGSITVNSATVNNNEGSGHDFAGAYLVAGSAGNVTINDSTFYENGWTGLQASGGGSFALANVTADKNGQAGALLTGGGNLVIERGSSFSSNQSDGLDASMGGTINASDLTVNSNNQSALILAGADLFGAGGVSIGPNASFSNNRWDGLHATASGAGSISLDGVTADANGIGGFTTAGTVLTAGAFGSVSINASNFNGNYHDALRAISGGSLTATNVNASGNQITAGTANGSTFLSAVGPMSITGSNFNNNGMDGLHASALGGITLLAVQGNQNALSGHTDAGVLLQSQGDISITDSTFSNNKWDGLNASALGNMGLKNVVANSNESGGITTAGTFLDAGGSIAIDPSKFNNNAGTGLIAHAGSNITTTGLQASGNGGNGFELVSGGDAHSQCDEFVNNGGYGVDATLPGTLTLAFDSLQGNVSGDFHIAGGGTEVTYGIGPCGPKEKYKTPTPPPSYILGPTAAATPAAAPQLNVLNVTDGQTVNLDCTSYSGTTLALSNRDQITLLCPVTGQAVLKHVTVDTLPSKLDTTMTYQSAMDAEVTQNGTVAQTLNGPMKVDFAIPANVQGTTKLSILHWDGTKWVDVGGTATPDGFIETITNQTGVFVLISR